MEKWFRNRQKKILQEYKGVAKSRKLSNESLASIFRNISDVNKLQDTFLCDDEELANGKCGSAFILLFFLTIKF